MTTARNLQARANQKGPDQAGLADQAGLGQSSAIRPIALKTNLPEYGARERSGYNSSKKNLTKQKKPKQVRVQHNFPREEYTGMGSGIKCELKQRHHVIIRLEERK
ncbi:hypothetical protein Fot_26912 [Forsythia ovata]|uniref:Uncharacterized protein n=1 Tax=Forsythia ovata TaxID=205694 RepID=A0ABD1UD73_9LAMI